MEIKEKLPLKRIRKAIIPVAGHGIRMMPATRAVRKTLFPIVDSEGRVRPVLQIIIEEAINAGIEEICLITAPEDEKHFRAYFSELPTYLETAIGSRQDLLKAAQDLSQLSDKLTYITQNQPRGLGDAVLSAKTWAGAESVLILLGDHLYQSREERCCARQLLDSFEKTQAPISGIIRKPEKSLKFFGTISGRPIHRSDGIFRVDTVVEKPEVSFARRHLRVEGIPEDLFLCWFGLHVMTPDLFTCLEQIAKNNTKVGGELQLTEAQAMLAAKTPYFALEIKGDHFDTGSPEGYVSSVAAFAKTI